MECNELVLNGDTMEEVQRLPGQNDVSSSNLAKKVFLIALDLGRNGCVENQISYAGVS